MLTGTINELLQFFISLFSSDDNLKGIMFLGRRKDRKPEALQALCPRLLPPGLGLQVSSAVDHRDQRRSNASEEGRPARGAQLGVPRVHEDNVRESARAPTVLSISVSSYDVSKELSLASGRRGSSFLVHVLLRGAPCGGVLRGVFLPELPQTSNFQPSPQKSC
jgi:hypothetical protein